MNPAAITSAGEVVGVRSSGSNVDALMPAAVRGIGTSTGGPSQRPPYSVAAGVSTPADPVITLVYVDQWCLTSDADCRVRVGRTNEMESRHGIQATDLWYWQGASLSKTMVEKGGASIRWPSLISFAIGHTLRVMALYRGWEGPLATEPTGVCKHDDGRPLLRRKIAGKSRRELRELVRRVGDQAAQASAGTGTN